MSQHTRNTDADGRRRRLYDVFDAEDLSLAEKRDQALEIGREYLGVENGHVERLLDDGETHEIVASVGREELVPVGMTIEQSKTFCRQTIEQHEPLAVSDAFNEGWADDPAYIEQGIACYLGTPILVEGEIYGTVCFVSEAPRERSFDTAERAFVELFARLLGREIESRRHERRLDERDRQVERSTQKYESLLSAAPDAILLIDAETGEIVEANDAAVSLTGYDEASLQAQTYADLHPSDEIERYRSLFNGGIDGVETRSRFADGTPIEIERRDGRRVPVEISATMVTLDDEAYVQGVLRDISDRRKRERELRVKNRAIDTASIGITIAAAEEGLPLVYVNDAFTDLTGYDTETALGQNCRFLQGPNTDPETIEDLRTAIADQEPITTELLNYRADGTPFWNEVTVTPVEDERGDVTHFVGFQRDVTERVRHERLISVLNRVLRHNLRNKTNVILGQASHLSERLSGEAADAAGTIQDAATNLAALSETAHDLETAVHEQPTPERRDVVPVVESAVEDCREKLDDEAIQIETPATARALVPARLDLAVTELVENALEHAGRDPGIGVRVETDEAGDVRVAVSDDGPGLAEHEQAVLDRGTGTPLEHGSGLGLSLVSWITTSVGGRVTADGDNGTTVTIYLPGVAE